MNPTFKKSLPIIITVVLLLLGAFAIYAILVGPSKQPYRDALTQYKNVYNANVNVMTVGSTLNASGATDAQFEESLEKVDKALESLKLENEALGQQKALSDGGEGETLYAAFNTKLQAYVEYNKSVLASMKLVRPTIYECTQRMSTVTEDAQGTDAMKKCAAELENLDEVTDADYKTMAASFRESYEDMAGILAKMQSLNDPDGNDKAAYDKLGKERDAIVDDLSAISTQFSKNLQASRAEVDITESAQKLDAYLTRKASIL